MTDTTTLSADLDPLDEALDDNAESLQTLGQKLDRLDALPRAVEAHLAVPSYESLRGSLRSIFRDHIETIEPADYQRRAAWDADSRNQFFRMVADAAVGMRISAGAFTVTRASSDPSASQVFNQTDGQQRSSQAYMLSLAAMRHILQHPESTQELRDAACACHYSTFNNSETELVEGRRVKNLRGACKFRPSPADRNSVCEVDETQTPLDDDTRDKLAAHPKIHSSFLGDSYRHYGELFSRRDLFPTPERVLRFISRGFDNLEIELRILADHVDPVQAFRDMNAMGVPLTSADSVKVDLYAASRGAGAGDSAWFTVNYWLPLCAAADAGKGINELVSCLAYAVGGAASDRGKAHVAFHEAASRMAARGDRSLPERCFALGKIYESIHTKDSAEDPFGFGKPHSRPALFARSLGVAFGIGVKSAIMLVAEAAVAGRLTEAQTHEAVVALESFVLRHILLSDIVHVTEHAAKSLAAFASGLSGQPLLTDFVRRLRDALSFREADDSIVRSMLVAPWAPADDEKQAGKIKMAVRHLFERLENPGMGSAPASRTFVDFVAVAEECGADNLFKLGNAILRKNSNMARSESSASKLRKLESAVGPSFHPGVVHKEFSHALRACQASEAAGSGWDFEWTADDVVERGVRLADAILSVWGLDAAFPLPEEPAAETASADDADEILARNPAPVAADSSVEA